MKLLFTTLCILGLKFVTSVPAVAMKAIPVRVVKVPQQLIPPPLQQEAVGNSYIDGEGSWAINNGRPVVVMNSSSGSVTVIGTGTVSLASNSWLTFSVNSSILCKDFRNLHNKDDNNLI
ncbi:hypothetical protein BB561_005250 [Smittium simulii]|uniref:Uncharacterized protein n=1 Tax=Smittium simulii TaxID=133385 RepID=A0A2T9YBE0_9FUNG|nr:hypothetical protein BB561_005250 [Smittium simulii]